MDEKVRGKPNLSPTLSRQKMFIVDAKSMEYERLPQLFYKIHRLFLFELIFMMVKCRLVRAVCLSERAMRN